MGTWTDGTEHDSGGISTVVQEITEGPDWASGNTMTCILTGTDETISRRAYSLITAPACAAQLQAVYPIP